jgi:hypothetical protein
VGVFPETPWRLLFGPRDESRGVCGSSSAITQPPGVCGPSQRERVPETRPKFTQTARLSYGATTTENEFRSKRGPFVSPGRRRSMPTCRVDRGGRRCACAIVCSRSQDHEVLECTATMISTTKTTENSIFVVATLGGSSRRPLAVTLALFWTPLAPHSGLVWRRAFRNFFSVTRRNIRAPVVGSIEIAPEIILQPRALPRTASTHQTDAPRLSFLVVPVSRWNSSMAHEKLRDDRAEQRL